MLNPLLDNVTPGPVYVVLGLMTLAVIIGGGREIIRRRRTAKPTADFSVLVDYYRYGKRYSYTRTDADTLADPSLLAADFRAELITLFGRRNIGPTRTERLDDGGVRVSIMVSFKGKVICYKMELVTDPALTSN